ncbi:MAG: hypothetical protein LBS93_08325, partial [Synergistaceae bacterium]|nr:hypothetical protein [Synergistaceae bacterium]
MKFLLASLFVLFSIAASAAPLELEPVPRPEWFDVPYELDLKDGWKPYEVCSTDEVPRNVSLSYEWDVAVFNSSGDIVPFMAASDCPPPVGEGFAMILVIMEIFD